MQLGTIKAVVLIPDNNPKFLFMLPENETRKFLGIEYAWHNAAVRLDDLQDLHGGVSVHIPSWGPAFVTQVAPGGQEMKFKVPFSRDERMDFYRLCIKQDFLTIQPSERPGAPDEARPSITLRNNKREEHNISKWAGVADARFDVIYQVLLDVAQRSAGVKPIAEKYGPRQKVFFWIGIVSLLLIPFIMGYFLAQAVLSTWWPENLGTLTGLLTLLIVAAPSLLLFLGWLERRKESYDRILTNSWLLIILGLIYFAVLVSLPGFLSRISLAVWSDTAEGAIVSLDDLHTLDPDAGPLDEYHISYVYQLADGAEYEDSVQVNRDNFESFQEGDSVVVQYLPFYPRHSLLDFQLEQETADYALLLYTAVFALYLFLLEAALFGPSIMRIQDERF